MCTRLPGPLRTPEQKQVTQYGTNIESAASWYYYITEIYSQLRPLCKCSRFIYSKAINEISGLFFCKIISQNLFSLRNVGNACVKNVVFGGHTFMFYFKIMHKTFLESKVEMLLSVSPPVHWRVQDTDSHVC